MNFNEYPFMNIEYIDDIIHHSDATTPARAKGCISYNKFLFVVSNNRHENGIIRSLLTVWVNNEAIIVQNIPNTVDNIHTDTDDALIFLFLSSFTPIIKNKSLVVTYIHKIINKHMIIIYEYFHNINTWMDINKINNVYNDKDEELVSIFHCLLLL